MRTGSHDSNWGVLVTGVGVWMIIIKHTSASEVEREQRVVHSAASPCGDTPVRGQQHPTNYWTWGALSDFSACWLCLWEAAGSDVHTGCVTLTPYICMHACREVGKLQLDVPSRMLGMVARSGCLCLGRMRS